MTHSEICPSLLTFKPKPDTPILRKKVLSPVVESISSQQSQHLQPPYYCWSLFK